MDDAIGCCLFHEMNDNLSTFVSSSAVYSRYLSLDVSKRSGPHGSSGHSNFKKISVVFPSEIQACSGIMVFKNNAY